ncbi:MAG: hypothetical protein ACFHXK_11900 [bacterium]
MHPDKHTAVNALNVAPALGLRTAQAPRLKSGARPRAYQVMRRPTLQPGHFVNLTI